MYLHPDDCVDEEEHSDEKANIRKSLQYKIGDRSCVRKVSERENVKKFFFFFVCPARVITTCTTTYLKRLNESPQEYPNGVALSQEFDQPGGTT